MSALLAYLERDMKKSSPSKKMIFQIMKYVKVIITGDTSHYYKKGD